MGIWNCKSVCRQIRQKTGVIAQKLELFRKKKQFHFNDFFSNKLKSGKKKESLQDKDCDSKVSCQMLPWILLKVKQRFRNLNIGGSFSLIIALYKIKGKILRWKKFMNGTNFLLRVMWFVKCWFHVISHYPVKVGAHRTFGIGDLTFFVCHKTIYNHDQRIIWHCPW